MFSLSESHCSICHSYMSLERKRGTMTYSQAVTAVYNALYSLDDRKQLPFVKEYFASKMDAILFPMEEFDEACQTIFGNHYSQFYKAVTFTNRISSFVLSDTWGMWNEEEEYFVSDETPADFIKDEFSFFQYAIVREDWLISFGFDMTEIKELKETYAKETTKRKIQLWHSGNV